jgi:uncharacterized protein YdiU (UPF0061 family)
MSPFAAFSNSYARLPGQFFVRQDPVPVARPRLIALNRPLAQELGLDVDSLGEDALAALFGGNAVPEGAEPLAMAYAGHQFGGFVPQLGDGRAILLGEVIDRQGARRDIQLKGAGRTAFSRGGDGRAALGPVLREYLVSEALHALGIPATRALAAVSTGEDVFREMPQPGAILTRVAASHIRVGTFQFFAARGDEASTRILADHVIDRHYPAARAAANPTLALLQSVADRQADLVARWMLVGFVHGVMNTDNMAVSGETIDFGPCAFLEAYDPGTVFSSIDRDGRYAFGNQANAARWNIARFAEALLPHIDADPERAAGLAQEVLDTFRIRFEKGWREGMNAKLGLGPLQEGDAGLAEDLLELLRADEVDFTLFFRRLCEATRDAACAAGPRTLLTDAGAWDAWAARWQARRKMSLADDPGAATQALQAMRGVNPAYIPRNHRVQQVISAAMDDGDFAPFAELLGVLSHPYEEREGLAPYAQPARPGERVLRTFCGT